MNIFPPSAVHPSVHPWSGGWITCRTLTNTSWQDTDTKWLYTGTFQLLEYQWSEGKFDKQTSSDPTRRFRQFYDWGNLNVQACKQVPGCALAVGYLDNSHSKGCEVIIVVFTIIFIKRIVNVQQFSYGRIARSHYNHLTELIRHHQPAIRSDARTLPTTTRVIIIVITMATVITIVIASQTLTSPPLPHPVPFGGQFGISQPLYPALAHFITRSCQIQSSSLCFEYHRNVARCHHCHQWWLITVISDDSSLSSIL